MNVDPMVIIMAILALGALVIQAVSAHKLYVEFENVRFLAQWAIEHVPPPADAPRMSMPYATTPAMPGEVRFHFPSILFPERPDASSSTLT